ncbi:MAG: hypothetical protein WC510_00870 [Candidatus Omnitrophota bacterium]
MEKTRYLLVFFLPFLLSLMLTPVVRRLALRCGLVSYPRADRWHKHPTALLGGTSIYLAFMLSVISLGLANKNVFGLFVGATALFIVGLFDDKFHFTPYTKLFIQIVCGCIAVLFGVVIGLPLGALIVIPLTLLWIVGVTNSFNLLDNIDGLAAGIAAISSFMLFFSSLLFTNNQFGMYSLVLAGAALGFLPYNFNPAKIFMGDSGSMFLGYSIAVISISGTTRHISNLFATVLIPVLILSVPIFDTLFVMVMRRIRGKRIFAGGTDHTSHNLVALGLSPKKTVLLLYIISIALGVIALSYSRFDMFVISVISFLAIVVMLFFGAFLSGAASYDGELISYERWQELRNNKTMLNNIFLHKRRITEIVLDLAFICIAYYSAYFLRFEGLLVPVNLQLIEKSLVWLVMIKISVFYIFGLYRGVWKYISISDLLTIFKAVSLGSAFSILFFTFLFRFQDFSRTVFFIDWLILLFLVAGSRIMFRVLGELFNRLQKQGKNILIYGAGDAGEMVIREIKRNKDLSYNPVGFIDDDPSKIGNRIQGAPILGSRENIQNLVHSEKIEEIIIAIPSLDDKDFREIARICSACGISYRKIKGILDEEEWDVSGRTKDNHLL